MNEAIDGTYGGSYHPPPPERIVAAALRSPDGLLTFSMDRPNRHHNVIRELSALLGATITFDAWEQGFLTSEGRFARRKPALLIARSAGQLIRKTQPEDRLFSEDLW